MLNNNETTNTTPATIADTMTEADKARFFAKLSMIPEPESGCILWMEAERWGYGSFRQGSKKLRAHRVAYELAYGPIPPGEVVRHLCHVKRCCNPAHLATGTHRENVDDRFDGGNPPLPMPPFTEGDKAAMAEAYQAGWSVRRVAEVFQSTSTHVTTILKARGVTMRPRGGQPKKQAA